MVLLALLPVAAARADVGFVGPSFSGATATTGMKPQSKLWVADGIWWGAMFNSLTQRIEIFRRTPGTETWSTTGTAVDARKNIWTDVKWTGTHLHVVSHGASWTDTIVGIRVSRYSYDSASKSWSLDSGYPLTNVGTTPGHIAPTGAEGVVLDVDSLGRIWITWTRDGKVWVTHSTVNQQTFVAPFVVPAAYADGLGDDMSSLVAYDGRVAVMWSNQNVMCMCFAVHDDGAPDGTWTARPFTGPSTNIADRAQELADDHLNLKAPNDGSGRVFAVTKTSLNGASDPLLLFGAFDGSSWSKATVATVGDDMTRAQVALDMQLGMAHVFAAHPCCAGGTIYRKQSSLTPGLMTFGSGRGEVFIQSTANPKVNNVTTTKQNIATATGLVVLGGDDSTKRFVHNVRNGASSDIIAPETTITSGPTGTVNTPSATFAFTASEADATFQCRLDGGAYASCTSPKSYQDLASGSHTFDVRAIDPAGNIDATPATRTWTVIDTTTIVDVPAQADTYAVSGSPSATNGTKTTLYTDKASTADPSDKQTFLRYDVAQAGQIVSAKLRLWVTDGSVSGPSVFATSNTWSEATLNWTNKPAATGPALATASAAATTGTWLEYDLSAAVKVNGTYSFTLTTPSTDATVVSSREATAAQRPVLRLHVQSEPDTVAPDTTITSGPANPTMMTNASFEFTSTETGSNFACSLDGAAFEACSSPRSHTVGDGSHTFQVRATDAAGNTDASPATWSWTVNSALPTPPTITSPAEPAYSASTTVTIGGTADAGDSITLQEGSEARGTTTASSQGTWSVTVTGLSEGAHTFTATASDITGTSGPSNARTVTVDTVAPDTTIDSGPANPTGDASASFALSSGEAPVTFECRLDGAAFAPCTTPHALSGLGDGSHAFEARAIDPAGNLDATPATWTWQVVPTILSDGFESGTLDAWQVATGGDGAAGVQSDNVKTDTFAARLSATANIDSFARLRFGLPPGNDAIVVDLDANVEQQGVSGGNVPLLRLFDGAGTRLLSLYRQNGSSGALWLSFGTPSTSVSLNTNLPLGTWATFRVRVNTSPASAGAVTVSMDGTDLYTNAQVTYSTAGVATVQLGNETKRQPFTLTADNVVISR